MKKILPLYLMKKFALIIFIGIFLSFSIVAAIYVSVIDGDWSTSSTWGGASSPPISTSDNITIQTDVSTISNITIKSGGYLTIKNGYTLTVNDMQFNNGSHISIEDGGTLVINGNLTNKINSVDVVVNGIINVSGSFLNGNGGIVSGTGCITVTIDYTGNGTTFGNVNNTIPSNSTICAGSMPVELLYFNYEYINNTIQLNWATASESNNDYFTISRSLDAVNFDEIGKVQGNGNYNGILYYSFIDKETLTGTSYYSLKQTDYDGNFKIIGLVSCEIILDNPYVSIYAIDGKFVYQGYYKSLDKLDKGVYIVISKQGAYKMLVD